MKFNVIIGNPPYQETTEGGSVVKLGRPIYDLFVTHGIEIGAERGIWIIPTRWYLGDKGRHKEFRKTLIESGLKTVSDFTNSQMVFDDVMISGGVCILDIDKFNKTGKFTLKNIYGENEVSIDELDDSYEIKRLYRLEQIIKKIKARDDFKSLGDSVLSSSPFGIPTWIDGSIEKTETQPYGCLTSDGIRYIDDTVITKNKDYIPYYKVILGYKTVGSDFTKNDGKFSVTTRPRILKPGEVCTQTYIVVNMYKNLEQAELMCKFLMTKFVRALILSRINGSTVSKACFDNVPNNPMGSSKEIYNYYNLTNDEINFIENLIRPYGD